MTAILAEQQKNKEQIENSGLTVADAVWIGTAVLHRSRPAQAQFSRDEIVASVQRLNLTNGTYKSIWQHVDQHCVANRKPQPNRVRMLYDTREGHRRLFRESSDRFDPERAEGRTHPDWDKLPLEYADLKEWYETVWNKATTTIPSDPLLALAGTGRGMWGGQSADAHVASLREGWESLK